MTGSREAQRAWLAWLAVLLVGVSALVAWPYASWILLATWISALARPLHARVAAALGDRPRVAAFAIVGALALLVVPVLVLVGSLALDAYALVERSLHSDRVYGVVSSLVSDGEAHRTPSGLLGIAVRAWAVLQQVAGTAVRVVVGFVILVVGTHALLVNGPRWYAWGEQHAPIAPPALGRLRDAFVETGRGLFFGVLGAGLAQAIVATLLYVALDVPEALALGLLTLVASVIPAIGTGIVWAPIAVGLWVSDRQSAAAVLAIAGVSVIGTIDNLVRPYLARRGSLQLPTYLVLVGMFGGVQLLGARGLLLGPLALRLAKEALALSVAGK